MIDSAESAAQAAVQLVNGNNGCPILSTPFGERVGKTSSSTGEASPSQTTEIHCFATDSVEKFERLGSRFLGQPTGNVELVDLGG